MKKRITKIGINMSIILLIIISTFTIKSASEEVWKSEIKMTQNEPELIHYISFFIHVDEKDSSGQVKPLENAKISAFIFPSLELFARGLTNKQGDCELKVLVEDAQFLRKYFIFAHKTSYFPKMLQGTINGNDSIFLEFELQSLNLPSIPSLGHALLNVTVEKVTFNGLVPVDNAQVRVYGTSPICFQLLWCRAIGTTNEDGFCSIPVRVLVSDEITFTDFVVFSTYPLYRPAIAYTQLEPNEIQEINLVFSRTESLFTD